MSIRKEAAHRSTNINIRVAPEQRDLIDLAALFTRKTRTDFILNAATRATEEALLDQALFHVSPEEYQAFMDALDRPSETNERLAFLLTRKPIWKQS